MPDTQNDPLGQQLKDISSEVKRYIEKRVELLLLNIGEEFSYLMAESVQKLTGIFFLLGATICLLVALAIYLGDVLHNQSLGYVIVSVPLLAIGLMLFYLRPQSVLEQLKNFFEREIIRALSGRQEEEEQKKISETTKES